MKPEFKNTTVNKSANIAYAGLSKAQDILLDNQDGWRMGPSGELVDRLGQIRNNFFNKCLDQHVYCCFTI